ncbi:MAG: anthranilate phosphoribosyltransferase [Ilumatobacteraceae bacterium]
MGATDGHRTPLTRELAIDAMRGILRGDRTAEQIKQFLLDYNAHEATPDELSGFLTAVREAATKVDLPNEIAARAIDIVGTGGDNSGSVNVSTMTSLVVAGAGVPVCKHGNRSASSKCGTADVLEALGARIDLSPEHVAHCVSTTGFGFVFAQKFHPAFRHVAPVRRELGVPTVFNMIGPMANPAPVAFMLVGVANPQRMKVMAEVLAQRTTSSLVVHGNGGLDELSLAGANRAVATRGSVVHAETTIVANDLGLPRATNDDLRGGDPTHNAQVVMDVLENRLHGPIRNVVVLNAAAALNVAGAADSLSTGITLAEASLVSGAARTVLRAFIEESQRMRQ